MSDTQHFGGPFAAAAALGEEAREERRIHERVARIEERQESQDARLKEFSTVMAELRVALNANTAATTQLQLTMAGRRECPDPGLCKAIEPRVKQLEATIGRIAYAIISVAVVGTLLAGWEYLRGLFK